MELLEAHDRLDPLSESHTGLSDAGRRTPQASAVAREDWQHQVQPELTTLSATQRSTLAEAWLADALEHHAAIARYARLSLHMLALAAPPELVLAAQQAARDKVHHVQLCLGLSNAYAGRSLGPGALPLPLESSGERQHVLIAAIADGCVAETLRAMFAESARARCQDPAVTGVLNQLAGDHRRHAGLSWRFVRWALSSTSDPKLAVAAREMFQLAANQHLVDGGSSEPAWLSGRGRLREHERAQIVDATLAEVVRPCAQALLSELEQSAASVA